MKLTTKPALTKTGAQKAREAAEVARTLTAIDQAYQGRWARETVAVSAPITFSALRADGSFR